MKAFSTFKANLLKYQTVKAAYDDLAPESSIAQAIIAKRLEEGLSQSELAEKVGTKQSAISRLESGNYNPSVSLLEKVAKALNLYLTISFTSKKPVV
jgi:ribosome-binding protein aMBF1 (putative translation factor)